MVGHTHDLEIEKRGHLGARSKQCVWCTSVDEVRDCSCCEGLFEKGLIWGLECLATAELDDEMAS